MKTKKVAKTKAKKVVKKKKKYVPTTDPIHQHARELARTSTKSHFEQMPVDPNLDRQSARALVDLYVGLQKSRIAGGNQELAIDKMLDVKSPDQIAYLSGQLHGMEEAIKPQLKAYVEQSIVGRWLLSIPGIGEVLAAGLLAHLEVNPNYVGRYTDRKTGKTVELPPRAIGMTAGSFWRFAGQDPTASRLEKGVKRQWNARLKTICWKVGEQFKKLGEKSDCLYAKLYRERKEFEVKMNEKGKRKEQAEQALTEKRFRKGTPAYAAYIQGKLPDWRVDRRAARYAVKIFLSHLHAVMYETAMGKKPPTPWVIQYGGHVHELKVPNWPLKEGKKKAA